MLARSRRLFLQSQVTLISDVARSKQQVETLHKASMDMNMSIFVKRKVKNKIDAFVKEFLLTIGLCDFQRAHALNTSAEHKQWEAMFCEPIPWSSTVRVHQSVKV